MTSQGSTQRVTSTRYIDLLPSSCCYLVCCLLTSLRPNAKQNGEFMGDINARLQHGLVGPFIKMPLYDAGMTALLVSEAQSLAELADVLGRTETAAMLRQRCVDMRAKMQAHLWNEQIGIFSNKFSGNASFYNRIGPTSFFPLFARAATDAQAERMMKEWLHSPTRFCISPTGDSKGNNDFCYWGCKSASGEVSPSLALLHS